MAADGPGVAPAGGPAGGSWGTTPAQPAEVLAAAEAAHAARLDAERAILRAAYEWVLLHQPDRLPAGDRRGRERSRPAGASGTPRVTEHAAAAFGARIQTSPYGARRLMADAVDLVHRLPRLQAGVEEGRVRVSHARHVADATRHLAAEEAAWVDAEVAESADGRLAWARFQLLVEGKVAAAAPELARERELAAARERSARMSRVNRHGMATFTIHAEAATIACIDAAVTLVVKRLEGEMPDAGINDRRLTAVALLANPASHVEAEMKPLRPDVTLYLHAHGESPVVRMEGNGPLTHAWVRGLIATARRVRATPVIDLAHQAPVDAYEIPRRLREHAVPHSKGGPHGAHYLVDHTGTRRIRSRDPSGNTTADSTDTAPADVSFGELLLSLAA